MFFGSGTVNPGDVALDWLPKFDTRSLNYKISQRSDLAVHQPRSRNWRQFYWLNQGNVPGCTGWGECMVMGASPRSKRVDDLVAMARYHEAQKQDQWVGENYEGSSVLGAMKAGVLAGDFREYWWATRMVELLTGISHHNGMEWGTDWYTGYFYPDSDGFINPTGKVEGGHAYAVNGLTVYWQRGFYFAEIDERQADPLWWVKYINKHETYFRIDNSWGQRWNKDGSCKVRYEVVEDVMMPNDSEFALPRKLKAAA